MRSGFGLGKTRAAHSRRTIAPSMPPPGVRVQYGRGGRGGHGCPIIPGRTVMPRTAGLAHGASPSGARGVFLGRRASITRAGSSAGPAAVASVRPSVDFNQPDREHSGAEAIRDGRSLFWIKSESQPASYHKRDTYNYERFLSCHDIAYCGNQSTVVLCLECYREYLYISGMPFLVKARIQDDYRP